MAAQPEYLLRTGPRRTDVVQVGQIGARHPEINRVKRDYGVFREVEGTGRRDRRFVRIFATRGDEDRGPQVSYAHGGRSSAGAVAYTSSNAAGVKSVLRRLRPQEAEELDALDREIAELQQQLGQVRNRRMEVIQRAWASGHVVRLQEVQALITEDGS